MDQGLDIETAAKGLAVLTAIPVVLFALWADYFERFIQHLKKESIKFDPAIELQKIRVTGVVAGLFQFFLYLAGKDVRSAYPLLAYGLFFGAILIQLGIQAKLEKLLRGTQEKPMEGIFLAVRAFISSLFAAVLYSAVFFAIVEGFVFGGRLAHASPAAMTAIVFVGAIIGILGGIAVNFAIAAQLLKKMLPTTAITDPELVKTIEGCFAKAKLRTPSLWMIELERFSLSTALVAGFSGGRGWFRPGLFISRSVVQGLNAEQLKAVILHEVSHISLGHLKKRFLFASGLIVSLAFAATFLVVLSNLAAHQQGAGDSGQFIGLVVGIAAFMIAFRLLARQNALQELQADIHSIEKLGATLEQLGSALRQLDAMNTLSPDRKDPSAALSGLGHPETERRLLMIRKYFEIRSQITAIHEKRPAPEKKDRAA